MPRAKKRDRDGVFQRKGAFYISFTDAQGRRRQKKARGAHTLQQARNKRESEISDVDYALKYGIAPPTKETFNEIVSRYLQHQKARLTPRAYERTRGIVEGHLKPAFGPMQLSKIRLADIQKYITTRAAAVSAGSAVKELNTMKHLLGVALEWELVSVNVARGVKPPKKVSAGRLRYLQPSELRVVLEACPEWLRPIVGLLAFTGMRRGEVLGLRWLDVYRDGEEPRILLPQTKNGDGRIVWLNTLACQVIDSIARNGASPTDRVFPVSHTVTPENVSLAFLRACRRVSIADFRLHDLRHTCASWLRMKGADLQDVAELLGHRDLRMTKRYSHLSPAHLSASMQRLDGAFGEELSGFVFGKELALPLGKQTAKPARPGNKKPVLS